MPAFLYQIRNLNFLLRVHEANGVMQARKNAEAVELAVRLDRLQQQAGSSMVTTNTLASMDEDDDSALKRFNIILKVRKQCLTC